MINLVISSYSTKFFISVIMSFILLTFITGCFSDGEKPQDDEYNYSYNINLYDDGESWRSFSPATVSTGESFSISTDIRNGGSDPSGIFVVKFYASTNTTITGSDYFIGSKTMSSIPGGSYANCDWSGTFPSGVPAGDYYIGWIIDSNGDVSETNESNNSAYKSGYQLTVQASSSNIDLYDDGETYMSFSPTTVEAGVTTINISSDIRNGGTDASGTFVVKLYASTNTSITTADHYIGSKTMSSIPGGNWANCDWSGTIPSAVPPGNYYIGWIIDAESQVSETDENNNSAYKTGYQLTVLPVGSADLTITSFTSPSSATQNQTFSVSATVKNNGTQSASSFRIGIYRSSDTIISTADTLLDYCYVSSLGSGSSTTCSKSVSISTTGSQYIGVFADYQSSVSEDSESNNTDYRVITINEQNWSGYATEDASVYSCFPDTNYLTGNLFVGFEPYPCRYRSFIKFNILSNIPLGATISFAQLRLYHNVPEGVPFDLRIAWINGSWSQDSLTWNSQPSFTNYTSNYFTISSTTSGYIYFDVTDEVQRMVNDVNNNGFAIKASAESGTTHGLQFYSIGYSGTSRDPYLEIYYLEQ